VLRLVAQWMASRVRHNDVPPALLAWITAHTPAASKAADVPAACKPADAVLAHLFSFADQATAIAASRTCETWALAARLPSARSDLVVVRAGDGLDALETHLAARTAGDAPCYVPFRRVVHLDVGRRWRRWRPTECDDSPLSRVLEVVHRLRRLSHVVVGEPAVWHALSPQASLATVHVDLDDAPATPADVCRVAANPATVTELGGRLSLTAASAPGWARFTHLRTLRLDRPGAMRVADAAPLAAAWPRLDRLAVRSKFPPEQVPLGAAALVSAVVRGRGPGAVTLAFLECVPRPPSGADMAALHLAALHVDCASPRLLGWLRHVRADRLVVHSWDPAEGQADVDVVDVLRTAARQGQACEVVLHRVEVVRKRFCAQLPASYLRYIGVPHPVDVVRVRVWKRQTARSMSHVDHLAQMARWARLCVLTFVQGQCDVHVAAVWLRRRLAPQHTVRLVRADVIECRRQ